MKKIISIVLCVCMAVSVAFTLSENNSEIKASSNIVKVPVLGVYNYKMASYILKYTNKERTKRGLSKLRMNKSLTKAAMTRACELSIYVSANHIRPNGKDRASLNRSIQWENTLETSEPVWGNASKSLARKIVKSWMSSPHHREGILKRNFKSIGRGVFQGNGWTFASQEFSGYRFGKKCTSKKVTKEKSHNVLTQKKYLSKKYFKLITEVGGSFYEGHKMKLYVLHKNPYDKSITANVSPKKFKISSSNKKVAKVNKKGEIKAVKKGVTTIKLVCKGYSRLVLKKTIRVKKQDW